MKWRPAWSLIRHMVFRRPAGPVQLTYFVTSKCNAKCIHCFYKENLNKGEDLSFDEIKKITENLPSLYFLVISGGEPFLREDLADIIIAYYNNTGVNEVVIPTNGFLSDKIVMCCKKILTSCPGLEVSLVISLDGPADIHDKIRGVPGGFEKAVKTFFEMKKLKHANTQLKISILSTLMSFNQLVMIDFLKFVKSDLKPDAFSVNFLRAGAKDPDLKDVRIENLKMILDIEEQELGKGGGL
ncbi:MAG: radical SAM protein, partial [Candidatus Aminicenantes bacterium]|nr:radical SAM protein [Candidatus Aminicenantes bacterium]